MTLKYSLNRMRVVVDLLCFLALTAALEPNVTQELSVFENFGVSMIDGMTGMKAMAREYLSEDRSSFSPDIIMMLGVLEGQICPQESQECNPGVNWLFGCNCRNEFQKLGECKSKPCQLFMHFKDNGPASLNRFIDAKSFEEAQQTIVDYIVVPVSNALCDCSEMIGASTRCAKEYDGKVFEMLGLENYKSMFNNVVDNLDWKSLKTVLGGFVEAGCGVKNEKDCVLELAKFYSTGGKILDNTFKGNDVCLSLVRAEKEVSEFVTAIATMDLETESLTSIINRVMGIYVDLEREAMCSDCAPEMGGEFYHCCKKHALEALKTREMKKSYNKLFKNMWSLFAEGDPPSISKAIKKLHKIYDIEKFCGEDIDVYREKNEECEALGY